MLQLIGSYLDTILMFGVGGALIFSGRSLVRKDGTESDVLKRIKLTRIFGAALIVGGFASLLLPLLDR